MKYMRSGKRWVDPIRSLIVAAVLAFTAAVQAQVNLPATWESQLYSDHPFVGKIFNSRTSKFLPLNDLLVAVEGASYLLLGDCLLYNSVAADDFTGVDFCARRTLHTNRSHK